MIDVTAKTWTTILQFAEPRLKRALDGLRVRGQGPADTEYHRGVADVLEDLLKLPGTEASLPKAGAGPAVRHGYPAPAPDHTHAGRVRPAPQSTS